MKGIDEEIALIRVEIKKAISSGDISRLIPLSKAAYALEKLIRTHRIILSEEGNSWENAIGNVIRDTMVPILTPELALAFINFQYQRRDISPETIKALQKIIDRQNESKLTENKNQKTEAK